MNEQRFRELISGNKRGVSASWARAGLRGLAWFYQHGIHIRQMAYDVGCKRPRHVSVPVISVGNLTTGGTGKTPFVAYLAHWFSERGVRIGLLSRGYRAHVRRVCSSPVSTQSETAIDLQDPSPSHQFAAPRFETVNDEKLVLNQLCPGVPHLQHKDRVKTARQAIEEFGCELLLLDDGFQHRRLARDLDIVLIDAMNPWGFGNLLPRGLLREPLDCLSRADLVVITRVDQCPHQEIPVIRRKIESYVPASRCLHAANRPERLTDYRGQAARIDSLNGQPVAAFCGIGNPDSFRKTLTEAGMVTAVFHTFPDHHDYSIKDLTELARQARDHEVSAIITTQKDLVKIGKTELGELPLWAIEIATHILGDQTALDQQLRRVLALVERGSNRISTPARI